MVVSINSRSYWVSVIASIQSSDCGSHDRGNPLLDETTVATPRAWIGRFGSRDACQFAGSCSHLEAGFCRMMQPVDLQDHAATQQEG